MDRIELLWIECITVVASVMFLGMENNESNNVNQMKTVEAAEATGSMSCSYYPEMMLKVQKHCIDLTVRALGLFYNPLKLYLWPVCWNSNAYNLFTNTVCSGLFKLKLLNIHDVDMSTCSVFFFFLLLQNKKEDNLNKCFSCLFSYWSQCGPKTFKNKKNIKV